MERSLRLKVPILFVVSLIAVSGCAKVPPQSHQPTTAPENNVEQEAPSPQPTGHQLQASRTVEPGLHLTDGCSAHSNATDISRLIWLIMLEIEMAVAQDLIAQHLNSLALDETVKASPALALSMERLFVLPTTLEHDFPQADAHVKDRLRQISEDLYDLRTEWQLALELWETSAIESVPQTWTRLKAEVGRLRAELNITLAMLSDTCTTKTLSSMFSDSSGIHWQLLVTNSSLSSAIGTSCRILDCFGGGGLRRLGNTHPLNRWNRQHLVRLYSEIQALLNHSESLVSSSAAQVASDPYHDIATAAIVRGTLVSQWLGAWDLQSGASPFTAPLDPVAVSGAIALYRIAVARHWDSAIESSKDATAQEE